MGSFNHELGDKLDPSTTYYVRAYASSDFGFVYGPETSITTSSVPSVGDYWNGGRVFYISSNHRLIARETNSSGRWSGDNVLIGASSGSDGESNTIIMANNGSDIAISTINSNHEGYEDWYIPSRDEMSTLRGASSQARLHNSFEWNSNSQWKMYWTSTEDDYRYAINLDNSQGTFYGSPKSYSRKYRMIRKETF